MADIPNLKACIRDLDRLSDIVGELEQDFSNSEVLSVLRSGHALNVYKSELVDDLRIAEESASLEWCSTLEDVLNIYNETKQIQSSMKTIESSLQCFHRNLTTVRQDIESLYDQSRCISESSVQQSNLESSLREFAEIAVVSPDLIKSISEDRCDGELFLSSVSKLYKQSRERIRLVSSISPSKEYSALIESQPVIEHLTQLARDRIREYVISRINLLVEVNSFETVQVELAQSCRRLVGVLKAEDSELHMELSCVYNGVVSRLYLYQFKQYVEALGLVPSSNPMTRKRVELAMTNDWLCSDAVVPGPSLQSVTCESQFRSCMQLLFDTFSIEATQNIFSNLDFVFDKAFSWFLQVDLGKWDILGLLIGLSVIEHFRGAIMSKDQTEHYSSWTSFLTDMENVLVSRLTVLVEYEIHSRSFGIPVHKNSVLADPTSAIEIRKLSKDFAEFMCAVRVWVERKHETSFPVNALLQKLAEEFVKHMLGLSKRSVLSKTNQLSFLLNNVHHVWFEMSGLAWDEQNPSVTQLLNVFSAEIETCANQFVANMLHVYFSPLVEFLTKSEKPHVFVNTVIEPVTEPVMGWFQNNWQSALSAVNRCIITSFPKMALAKEVFKKFLSRLIAAYEKVHKRAKTDSTNLLVDSSIILAEANSIAW